MSAQIPVKAVTVAGAAVALAEYESGDKIAVAYLDVGAMASVADAPSDGKTYGRKNGAWAEAGGGGGITWSAVSAATTMAANNAYIVTDAVDMTLPSSVAAGDQFIVHALGAAVRVVANGNIINRVGSGNNLTLADGETVWLVAQAAGNLEIV